MQSIEFKYFQYSEIYKKVSSQCSLTYWEIKTNGVIKLYNLLMSSKFKGYTAYCSSSMIRRIETKNAIQDRILRPTLLFIIHDKKD